VTFFKNEGVVKALLGNSQGASASPDSCSVHYYMSQCLSSFSLQDKMNYQRGEASEASLEKLHWLLI
jgi:hypothetical protein